MGENFFKSLEILEKIGIRKSFGFCKQTYEVFFRDPHLWMPLNHMQITKYRNISNTNHATSFFFVSFCERFCPPVVKVTA